MRSIWNWAFARYTKDLISSRKSDSQYIELDCHFVVEREEIRAGYSDVCWVKCLLALATFGLNKNNNLKYLYGNTGEITVFYNLEK